MVQKKEKSGIGPVSQGVCGPAPALLTTSLWGGLVISPADALDAQLPLRDPTDA